jgi:small subunit ribosomal protein S9
MSGTREEAGRTGTLADLKNIPVPTGPAGTAASEAPVRREPKRDAQGRSYATGRRKDAVARVWI